MFITKERFGTLCDGSKVSLYKISNKNMSVCVTDYGCTLTSILLPNGKGGADDVLLGYSTLDGYINSNYCFGTIVGRFANRIGNANFYIGTNQYKLDKNDNDKNTLHGGFFRYDHILWDAKVVTTKDGEGVRFCRISPEGEQGFPGNLKLTVTYTLNEKNQLTLKYKATTDSPTPINITNHAYFNLHGSGTVLDQELSLKCDKILEVDKDLIPTGKILKVQNTPYDFTKKKTLGKDINSVLPGGYDNCYVTDAYVADFNVTGKMASQQISSGLPTESKLVRVATLVDPTTKRRMTLDTNQEGVQLYTGNWIDGIVGKNGRIYKQHDAVCLETQCFPDTPNKNIFPPCILQPQNVYKAITVYQFEF